MIRQNRQRDSESPNKICGNDGIFLFVRDCRALQGSHVPSQACVHCFEGTLYFEARGWMDSGQVDAAQTTVQDLTG